MSDMIPGNHKHLTLNDRQYIAESLNEGLSFKMIAKVLCKDPSTISKEVKLHRNLNTWNRGSFNNPYNFCVHRFNCHRSNVCNKLLICDQPCRSCHKCNKTCAAFELERCSRLQHAPFVCNGCKKPKNKCTIANKYDYDPAFAQRKYEELRASSREGINRTKSELHSIDDTITPLIRNGQSPYMILKNHPELNMSVRTLYNYIEQGVLITRNIDLKRKVKFKPRKSQDRYIKDRDVFIGRLHEDFVNLAPDRHVQMDTVKSAAGSNKCILTLCFPEIELLLAFMLEKCSPYYVKTVFNRLEKDLGTYDFLQLFETVLTDRGVEFGDPDSLETGISGTLRTSIYYCDPMRSCQKGSIENIHTMLRMIIPKGTVFTNLSQWDLKKAVNHINSAPRASLDGRTPYQLALERFGPEILETLQLRLISPDDVMLSPKLLKK